MLEVHITGWAATADDSSTLTVAQLEASQTGDGEEELPVTKASLPMVELYTQFGSHVSGLSVYVYGECRKVRENYLLSLLLY